MPIEIPTQTGRASLSGYLNCVCETNAQGHSILTRKEYRVPIHISKPYWDGHALLLNMMSPTAGMLEGDHVAIDVQVNSGATLIISNPASLRIHKMSTNGEATWTQRFRIKENAFLESNPEWLILQAESSFTQRTEIEIENGGELFFIEAVAPGRIAHGEAFDFRLFRNRLTLRYNGDLTALEKHVISPSNGTHEAWNTEQFPKAFYVSIFIGSEKLRDQTDFFEQVREMKPANTAIGISQLAAGPCWNIKAISSDPTALREVIAQIRHRFYESVARPTPNLRRQ